MADSTKEPDPRESVDFRAVAKVANRVRLRDVRLAFTQTGRFVELAEIDPSWPDSAFIRFNSEVASSADEAADSADLVVSCGFFCHYRAGISPDSDEPPDFDAENPPSIAVEAVFELVYELSDPTGIEDSDLGHFAFANGTHNAWPYWREFAQSMTQRLGVKPYVAGPFKLPSAHDPETDSEG